MRPQRSDLLTPQWRKQLQTRTKQLYALTYGGTRRKT